MTLDNPGPLATKAACASTLAYLVCVGAGIPDGLSAAFIAVVCVTPTVLAGLRRAIGQGVASLVGGGLAALWMQIGLPTGWTLGLSVGGAVLGVFSLGFGRAHTVAAFTAIYMHLLPLGGPGQTLSVRVAAIGVGALSAMTVNTLVSAMFYDRIFARRLRRVAEHVAGGAEGIATGDIGAMLPAFETVGALSAELAQAEREMRWRRNTAAADGVAQRRRRAQALGRVAHFAHDLGVAVDEANSSLTVSDQVLLRHVADSLRDKEGEAPKQVGEIGARVVAALSRYRAIEEQSPVTATKA